MGEAVTIFLGTIAVLVSGLALAACGLFAYLAYTAYGAGLLIFIPTLLWCTIMSSCVFIMAGFAWWVFVDEWSLH